MAAKKHFNFSITYEPVLTNPAYPVDERARVLLEKTYFEVTTKKGNEKELLKYVEEYPGLPQFKNRLATYYLTKGKPEKAKEINTLALGQHPDYLFAKLTAALDYYNEKEFSKIPDVLGERFELDALYPGKKSFHIAEVMNYYKVVALYLNAIDKTTEAWDTIERMDSAYPGHPETEETTKEIMRVNLSKIPERWKKDKETEITISGSFIQSIPKTNKPPVFENELIKEIYSYDFKLPSSTLQQLLLLPEESLKRDLKKALYDSIARYGYFMENDDLPGEASSFLLHALFITAEKKWTDLLPDIFNILKNGEVFNDFYFGDTLTELLWIAWYKLAEKNVQPLFDFLKDRNTGTFSKTAFNKALIQLYYQNKELRQKIVTGYKELAAYFIENKDDDALKDTVVIASVACAMRDISLDEMENEIKQLYEHNLISLGYAGNYESLIKHKKNESQLIENIPGIYEMYEKVVATWTGYKEDGDDDIYDDDWVPQQPIVRTEPKTGRNDPCPCGSGKKYKKCCLDK